MAKKVAPVGPPLPATGDDENQIRVARMTIPFGIPRHYVEVGGFTARMDDFDRDTQYRLKFVRSRNGHIIKI